MYSVYYRIYFIYLVLVQEMEKCFDSPILRNIFELGEYFKETRQNRPGS